MTKSSTLKLLSVAACLTATTLASAQDSSATSGFAWDADANSYSTASSSSSSSSYSTSSYGGGGGWGGGGGGGNHGGGGHHGGGGGGNNVPLDAGLSLLLAAGAGMGIKKMLRKKEVSN